MSDVPAYTLITATDAHALMQQNTDALLVDVRSEMEYLMIGHPVGSVNIAWIDEPTWERNPRFAAEVRKLLLGRQSARDQGRAPLILICRSDNRSREAANTLLAAGVVDVMVIENGFEGPLNSARRRSTISGWRFSGLPWEQC